MGTVLIVDDDFTIRETLREFLEMDHECHTADRAEQALAFLEAETYDVVVTDIAMPRLSGRAILEFIQANHADTPVIVISGSIERDAGKELLAQGAFAYFSKPFNLNLIEAAVGRAVVRHGELVGASK